MTNETRAAMGPDRGVIPKVPQQRGSLPMAVSLTFVLALACTTPMDPSHYRLAGSGTHWDVSGDDHVLDDLLPRYPTFFEVALDPQKARLPDLRTIRDDLEREPVTRRNFDALNAVAIAYFEANYQAETSRGDGLAYLALSQQSAKLLAVPWKAYGLTEDGGLRDAILDFFEDAATGGKLNTAQTASRLERIVDSLAAKESDSARLARIRALVASLRRDSEGRRQMWDPRTLSTAF